MSERRNSDNAEMPRPKHKIPVPPAQDEPVVRHQPAQPMQQRQPVQSSRPAQPMQQRQPVQSSRPVQQPMQQRQPVQSSRPAQPMQQRQSVQSSRPAQPMQQRQPVQSGRPAQPQRRTPSAVSSRSVDDNQNTLPLPVQQARQYTEQPVRSAAPQQRQSAQSARPAQQPQQRSTENRPPRRRPQEHATQTRAPRKRRKSRIGKMIRRILGGLALFFVVIFAVYSFAVLHFIGKMNLVESEERAESSHALLSESYVTSVLLMGTDSRDDSRGRSDAMILLSINKKTKEITMSSIMRDLYVNIPGYGWNKLNAAYSYGGADLLMDTLEENLHVRIDDYVQVDFSAFVNVVDAVGGVEITVSDEEAAAINAILHDEVNALMGDDVDADYLSGGGTYTLNGKQALSYSRIRYVGNSDFERTERQRRVLSAIFSEVKSGGIGGINDVMRAALPQMVSNMTKSELYRLSLRLPTVIGYDIAQLQIPAPDTWTNGSYDCGSVLEADFEANIELLEETVFADH